MINNKHVDEEIGNPLSDAYKKFRASCIDGNVPITADGAPIDVADDSTDTKLCLKTDEQTTMFRRFIMDTNILDGMDASANNTLGAQ